MLNIDMSNEELIKFYINKPVKISKINYKTSLISQKEIRTGNSKFSKAGCESKLVAVKVPENYPLKYDGQRVKTIRIHELISDRLEAALKDIIEHYGSDIEKVAPGACIYDGSYNFRKLAGGSSQSIHSWGLALDFDAANNTMKMTKTTARLAKPIYKPFFDILEAHGFKSLGRRSNMDFMHLQAALWDE